MLLLACSQLQCDPSSFRQCSAASQDEHQYSIIVVMLPTTSPPPSLKTHQRTTHGTSTEHLRIEPVQTKPVARPNIQLADGPVEKHGLQLKSVGHSSKCSPVQCRVVVGVVGGRRTGRGRGGIRETVRALGTRAASSDHLLYLLNCRLHFLESKGRRRKK